MHEGDTGRARAMLIYLSVGVLAASCGVGATVLVHRLTTAPAAVATPTAPLDDSAVFRKVEPGVVDVSADLRYLNETAEGTGFVIDAANGIVLTNNHVIDGATSVTITPVLTGKAYVATVLGYDLPADVAVLQVKGVPGLKAVTLGDSRSLHPGAQVLALGNEAGQGGPPTIAPGVISGTGRSIVASDSSSGLTETLHGMLQTSADIRPGDSGGPLANASGQVIGIDTAAGDGGPGMAFAGYAIPIDTALTVARAITSGRGGAAVHIGMPAFLGVLLPSSDDPDPRHQARQQDRAATSSGRACMTGTTSQVPSSIAPVPAGALVDGVVCGTPAAGAGLIAGDVITGFDGHPVTSARALSRLLGTKRPGERGGLDWVSPDGSAHHATVTLTTAPAG